MPRLNPLDLVLLIVFAAALVDGIRRGFTPYALELISLVVSLTVAFAGFTPFAWVLQQGLSVPADVARLGAFLVLLLLAHGVTMTALRRSRHVREAFNAVDHVPVIPVSALPALATAVVIAALVVSAVAVLPAQPARSLVLGSSVGSALTRGSAFVQPPLRTLVGDAGQRRLTVADHAQTSTGDDFYRLHLPSHLQLKLDTKAELRMLDLLNQSRKKAALPALSMDPQLQTAARQHSLDMFERAYFSHLTPEHKTPFDRIKAAGVRFVTAGENIAFAADVDQAETSLMDSPDHRANILSPDFKRVGIGVYAAPGGYQEMFTQDFSD